VLQYEELEVPNHWELKPSLATIRNTRVEMALTMVEAAYTNTRVEVAFTSTRVKEEHTSFIVEVTSSFTIKEVPFNIDSYRDSAIGVVATLR
jgi:hypothetical protein